MNNTQLQNELRGMFFMATPAVIVGVEVGIAGGYWFEGNTLFIELAHTSNGNRVKKIVNPKLMRWGDILEIDNDGETVKLSNLIELKFPIIRQLRIQ